MHAFNLYNLFFFSFLFPFILLLFFSESKSMILNLWILYFSKGMMGSTYLLKPPQKIFPGNSPMQAFKSHIKKAAKRYKETHLLLRTNALLVDDNIRIFGYYLNLIAWLTRRTQWYEMERNSWPIDGSRMLSYYQLVAFIDPNHIYQNGN